MYHTNHSSMTTVQPNKDVKFRKLVRRDEMKGLKLLLFSNNPLINGTYNKHQDYLQ